MQGKLGPSELRNSAMFSFPHRASWCEDYRHCSWWVRVLSDT